VTAAAILDLVFGGVEAIKAALADGKLSADEAVEHLRAITVPALTDDHGAWHDDLQARVKRIRGGA
jgi:hypothetical protein